MQNQRDVGCRFDAYCFKPVVLVKNNEIVCEAMHNNTLLDMDEAKIEFLSFSVLE